MERALLLVSIANLIHMLAVNMVQPLLGLHVTALGGTPLQVGFVVSCFGLLPMFLAIPTGLLGARVGTEAILKAGAVLTILPLIALVLDEQYYVIVLAQTALGCAHVLSLVASQSYVATASTDKARDRNFGYFGSLTAIGMTAGPAVAGGVATVAGDHFGEETAGFRVAFAVAMVFAIFQAIASWAAPALRQKEEAVLKLKSVFVLLRRRGIQVATLSTFVHMIYMAGRISFYPIFLAEVGYTPGAIGLLFTVHAGVSILVRPFMGVMVGMVGRDLLLTLCLFTLAAAMLTVTLSTSFYFQLVNMTLGGLAIGIDFPLMLVMITSCCKAPEYGVAMGLRFTVNRVTIVVVPVIVGAIAGVTGLAVALQTTGVMVLAMSIVTAYIMRREERELLM